MNPHQSTVDYITATKMSDNGTWVTDVEIYALTHMLQTCVFLGRRRWPLYCFYFHRIDIIYIYIMSTTWWTFRQ